MKTKETAFDGLSEGMTLLRQLANGIAHEINNPLTVIVGKAEQLQTLLEGADSDPEMLMKFAKKIRDNAVRIAHTVTSIQCFAGDWKDEEVQSVPLPLLVERAMAVGAERFEKNAVKVTSTGVAKELRIECRMLQVCQALVNVIQNAHEAAEGSEEKWISIDATPVVDGVEIRVRDSGAGISEVIQDRIMEPFFTTKEGGRGSGLGLSLSLAVVRSHHGKLFLESGQRYTTFVIELPYVQPSTS